ncbi:hypothetical protein G3N57_09095 [Paraburkholderia sp. Se-20369]|nr:hypothetical protein [Paraburkholderia sp. Se-20369]
MMFEREQTYLRDQLVDENGAVIYTFDLSELDLAPQIGNMLLRALAAEYGHTALSSQKRAFHAVRQFVLFLQDRRFQYLIPLPLTISLDFHKWLMLRPIKSSSKQSIENNVKAMLRWCGRNTTGLIDKNTVFDTPGFVRSPRSRTCTPSPAVAKAVLQVCYREIEVIERRLAYGRTLLDGGYEKSEKNDLLAFAIKDLLAAGNGCIPTQREIGHIGVNLTRRVAACGGLTIIRSFLSLMVRDILPFYLAIVIQTAGNPEGIRLLKVHCITQHPLRDDIEFLSWSKPRSARDQRVDFPVKKEWSAPNIVRRLMALNANLRSLAKKDLQDYVFISSECKLRDVNLLCVQSLHNYLDEFIEKNNFPNFDFKSWRPTIAREYRNASGSLESARHRLNHQSVSTTANYVAREKFDAESYKAIAEFQGSLVRTEERHESNSSLHNTASNSLNRPYETVFGFACRDPYSGLDGISPVGELCLSFTRCCSCPGALIPVDSPKVISRILSAKLALEYARRQSLVQGWNDRFVNLYADTLRIIEDAIVPLISEDVMRKALEIVDHCFIPNLE